MSKNMEEELYQIRYNTGIEQAHRGRIMGITPRTMSEKGMLRSGKPSDQELPEIIGTLQEDVESTLASRKPDGKSDKFLNDEVTSIFDDIPNQATRLDIIACKILEDAKDPNEINSRLENAVKNEKITKDQSTDIRIHLDSYSNVVDIRLFASEEGRKLLSSIISLHSNPENIWMRVTNAITTLEETLKKEDIGLTQEDLTQFKKQLWKDHRASLVKYVAAHTNLPGYANTQHVDAFEKSKMFDAIPDEEKRGVLSEIAQERNKKTLGGINFDSHTEGKVEAIEQLDSDMKYFLEMQKKYKLADNEKALEGAKYPALYKLILNASPRTLARIMDEAHDKRAERGSPDEQHSITDIVDVVKYAPLEVVAKAADVMKIAQVRGMTFSQVIFDLVDSVINSIAKAVGHPRGITEEDFLAAKKEVEKIKAKDAKLREEDPRTSKTKESGRGTSKEKGPNSKVHEARAEPYSPQTGRARGE